MPCCECPGSGKLIDLDGFFCGGSKFFLSECGIVYMLGENTFDLVEIPIEEFDIAWIGKNYLRKDAGEHIDAGVFLPIYLWSGYKPDPAVALSMIESMEYPGRLIIAGMDKAGNKVVFYAITGRSSSSQARRLINVEDISVKVDVTDPEILAKGDSALLVYSAALIEHGCLVVTNGAQTDSLGQLVFESIASGATEDQVYQVFRDFRSNREDYQMITQDGRTIDLASFEPDDPNWTPRISSILGPTHYVLDIIAKGTDKTCNNDSGEYEVRCGYKYYPGIGRVISTYSGDNVDPLPSFRSYPVMINLPWENLESATNAIYKALGPEEGKDDLRVSVVGIQFDPTLDEFKNICIINRHE